MQMSNKVNVTVEILSLEKGMYLFTVRSGARPRIGNDGDLLAPALRIGPAPGVPARDAVIVGGPRSDGNWLCRPTDMIVVRAAGEPTRILLTSFRVEGQAPLEVKMERLDQGRAVTCPEESIRQPPATPAIVPAVARQSEDAPAVLPAIERAAKNERRRLRMQITVHVKDRGEMRFSGREWAGCIGENLPIESFSILPLEELTAGQIEYKALTATGIETPWVSDGAPCGTRGMAVALVGFAVRIKPRSGAPLYVCEYRGSFLSGKTAGPFRKGVPCQSVVPDDLLQAIELSVFEGQTGQQQKAKPGMALSSRQAPQEKPPGRKPVRSSAALLSEPAGG